MIEVEKHIAYWRDGAAEDWEVASELIVANRTRHGLFFAHLALEKLLKAHVCRHTKQVPPRIHNLPRLAEIAGLRLDQRQLDILADMNPFSRQARYPDLFIPTPSPEKGKDLVGRAAEVYQWLMSQL
ncbi:MAG: HEPN domain-containing protein [Planctomycetes bacterium]|nr:HEPN domain-containing protein [Planctomycetota bacterium]